MLTVYTYPISKPANCFDLSVCLLGNGFAEAIVSIAEHQTSGTIWLGYLEGWMLTPHEEVVIRKALRNFSCVVVSHFPLSFSHAWQNEIDWVYTTRPHGSTDTYNNGSSLHDGGPAQYGHSCSQSSTDRLNHQN